MHDSAQYAEWCEHLREDIRMEVVLSELTEHGLRLDDVIIESHSLFKRNYQHDIEAIGNVNHGRSRKTKLSVAVNRQGIYDQLPEDLFHQLSDATALGKEEIILELK